MASCLLRRRFKCLRTLHKEILFRNAYIVLLPELPEQSLGSSDLLQVETLPKYKSLTPENCLSGVGKLVLDFECGIHQLEEKLKDTTYKKTFNTVIEPIEKLSAPLGHAWSAVKNLYMVRYSKDMETVYKTLHPRVHKARFQRFQTLPIYHAVKELHADQNSLNEVQQRIVQKYLLESRLSGIDLPRSKHEHFNVILGKISHEQTSFRSKLQQATEQFSHTIHDHNIVRNFPDFLLRLMAKDSSDVKSGPWELTLKPQIYEQFMQYCSDRDLRLNAWLAYVGRASGFYDSKLDNSVHIEEIRFQRRDEAKLLGYETYADLSMETKMAGSVQNVMSMIASLQAHSRPAMENELAELQEFAISNGFHGRLELWDIPYWRRKHKKSLFSLDDDIIRKYFPLPVVLKGLFEFCKLLFGVTIKECTQEVDIWNESVTFYKVLDENGNHLGSFFLDPYFRLEEKPFISAWIETGANRSEVAGTIPLAYMILHLMPPTSEMPSLLNFEELTDLFKKFGHCLQHILTTVPYSEVSGITNIEWDAVDICPNVMANFLYDDTTISLISNHCESNQPLPLDILDNIKQARCHMAGYDLTSELYLSALDIALYSSKVFWVDVMNEAWKQYLPFPVDKKNSHLCSFSTILSEEYAAAYYSFKWSEMIAADIFSAFLEANEEGPESIKELGRRFRKTYLSLGGGCHQSEVFRRFRGRDPCPDALLRFYALKD